MLRRALLPAIATLAVTVALTAIAGCGRSNSTPTPSRAATLKLPAGLDELDPLVRDALRKARAFVAKDPDEPFAWLEYGRVLHANEFFEQAADAYRISIELDDSNTHASYMLGLVATRLGRPEEAIEAFRTALDPTNMYAPAFWRQGFLLLEQGDAKAALPAFDEAIRFEGALSPGGLGRARALMALGRADEAIPELEAFAQSNAPNAGYALNLLATAYRRAGRFADAAEAAARSRDATPEWDDPWERMLSQFRPASRTRLDRAREYIRRGRSDVALRDLEALRLEDPSNVTVLCNLGLAYRQTGKFREALETLLAALREDEDFFLAHFHLAVLYAQISERKDAPENARPRAEQHLERVLALNPTYAGAHSLRGDLARLRGEPEIALKHYREAARCDPLDARWWSRTGITLVELGRWVDASTALEKAVLMDPVDADGWRGLAAARMKVGRLAEADRAISEAALLAPADPRVRATREQIDALRNAADRGGSP